MLPKKLYSALLSIFLCATSLVLFACGGSKNEETIIVGRPSPTAFEEEEGQSRTPKEAFDRLSNKGVTIYQKACIDIFILNRPLYNPDEQSGSILYAEIKATDVKLAAEQGFNFFYNYYFEGLNPPTPFVQKAVIPCVL